MKDINENYSREVKSKTRDMAEDIIKYHPDTKGTGSCSFFSDQRLRIELRDEPLHHRPYLVIHVIKDKERIQVFSTLDKTIRPGLWQKHLKHIWDSMREHLSREIDDSELFPEYVEKSDQ